MKTEFSNRFLKDIEKLTDPAVKVAVADIIDEVEAAASVTALTNL